MTTAQKASAWPFWADCCGSKLTLPDEIALKLLGKVFAGQRVELLDNVGSAEGRDATLGSYQESLRSRFFHVGAK